MFKLRLKKRLGGSSKYGKSVFRGRRGRRNFTRAVAQTRMPIFNVK